MRPTWRCSAISPARPPARSLYNAFHILVWPAILFVAGLCVDNALAMQVAAVWTAHIAMDRALGYGLKLPTGFADTHLGRIGKR